MATAAKFSNRLFAALSPGDFALLRPHFEPVELPRLATLGHPGRRIDHVHFMEAGIASIVAVQSRVNVEVGLVGNEGMTGLEIVNDSNRSPYSTFMQIGGAAQRMPALKLRQLAEEHASLRRTLARYTQAFMIQVTQTAVANARATIEERLARWLLMARDRVPGDDIPLTHEFLSVMMGAGRPGVTAAIHVLAKKGMIRGGRGIVRVLDHEALRQQAGHYYGLAEREYDRLLHQARAQSRNA